MMKALFSIQLEIQNQPEEDNRLLFSAAFVFLVFSLTVAHLYTKNMLWEFLGERQEVKEAKFKAKENDKVYEVLVEQELKDLQKTEERKALSDSDSSASGGITPKEGFHTNTPFREFIFGGMSIFKQEHREESQDEIFEFQIGGEDVVPKKQKPVKTPQKEKSQQQQETNGQMTKIPFNYRFEQDFLFRWTGSKITKIPTKKLAGYAYFKNMLRKIEENFAPPGGGNFAYRDMAGYVISEGIIPGEIKVQFLLNEAGQVIDVRKVTSHGQAVVDRACVDSIKGQNFGPVPEEVKAMGLIFGINFIFPGTIRY